MGCAASKTTPPGTAEAGNENSVPKPVAFEIPIDESEDASKSKKPPPQILQRLEEQTNQNSLTEEELKEKLQKAEERRQEILEEKCRVARQTQKAFSRSESASNGDENLQNGEKEQTEEGS